MRQNSNKKIFTCFQLNKSVDNDISKTFKEFRADDIASGYRSPSVLNATIDDLIAIHEYIDGRRKERLDKFRTLTEEAKEKQVYFISNILKYLLLFRSQLFDKQLVTLVIFMIEHFEKLKMLNRILKSLFIKRQEKYTSDYLSQIPKSIRSFFRPKLRRTSS